MYAASILEEIELLLEMLIPFGFGVGEHRGLLMDTTWKNLLKERNLKIHRSKSILAQKYNIKETK